MLRKEPKIGKAVARKGKRTAFYSWRRHLDHPSAPTFDQIRGEEGSITNDIGQGTI